MDNRKVMPESRNSKRAAQVCFDQPYKVDHSSSSTEIDEAVQLLPALAAHASNPAGGGCKGQRQHQEPCGHSGCDESAPGNVMQHFVNVKKLVEPDIRH